MLVVGKRLLFKYPEGFLCSEFYLFLNEIYLYILVENCKFRLKFRQSFDSRKREVEAFFWEYFRI